MEFVEIQVRNSLKTEFVELFLEEKRVVAQLHMQHQTSEARNDLTEFG